jgi:ATP-dependent DNA helicase DinG
MSERLKELFNYNKKEEFRAKLSEWIGDVFYDILPEQGYEVRDEQIYTAFQLSDAICNKKVHLAEAGLGTGKTFAYLLPAIAYARFSGKPVVIACASTALQEQLGGPNGDIETLGRILGIEIDARMAKDPRQYICDVRVNEYYGFIYDDSDKISNDIHQWLLKTQRGERSEIPHVSDQVWKKISWDESVSCETCPSRGHCKLVKVREDYRGAKDLIIADHEIFFHDLWTRDEKIDDDKMPILPSYSAVIFDEGHKVMLPAAMKAGHQINMEDIDNIILALEEIQEARESLISIVGNLEKAYFNFFKILDRCTIPDEESDRLSIRIDEKLLKVANDFHKALNNLHMEIQIEQDLYTESLPNSLFQTYQSVIERAMIALSRLYKNKSSDVITWVDKLDSSFWVVPRTLNKMLDKYLFQKGLPVVFTSATLSNEGDFTYFKRTLGLKDASYSTVESPFNIKEQVVVHLPKAMPNSNESPKFSLSIEQLISLLKLNKGRALVLTTSLEEVRKIRRGFKDYKLPFEVLWEDKGERGYLIRKFKEDVSSVLVGYNFWEGIDVPGEALSLLVVWQLPFPSLDPLIEVKRIEAKNEGLDPKVTVDYPEMGLKLKQGCGRLIRTKEDKGIIAIMDPVLGSPWENVVMGAIPKGAKIKTIEELLNI